MEDVWDGFGLMHFKFPLAVVLFIYIFSIQVRAVDYFGHATSFYDYFPQGSEVGRDDSRPGVEVSLSLRDDFLDSWKWKVTGEVSADPLSEVDAQKWLFRAPEAVFEGRFDWGSLRLGLTTFEWGVTEGYDPLNVVNSQIFWNPLSSKKLSTPSIVFEKSIESLTVEFIYVPINRSARYPEQGSRWLPSSYLVSRNDALGVVVLPDTLLFSYRDTSELAGALSHNYGIRLSEFYEDIDWSLVFYEGASPTPLLDVFATVDSVSIDPETEVLYSYVQSNIELQPVVHRQRTLAGSFVYNLGPVILRYAGNYQSSLADHPTLIDWTQGNALGVEWGVTGDLVLLSEYSYISSSEDFDNSVTSPQALFSNTAALGFRFSFSEDLSAQGAALFNIDSEDQVFSLNFSARLWEILSATLAWTEIRASDKPNSILGSYGQNDTVKFELKYSF